MRHLVENVVLIRSPSHNFFLFLLLVIMPPLRHTHQLPVRDEVTDYHIMGRQIGGLISDLTPGSIQSKEV